MLYTHMEWEIVCVCVLKSASTQARSKLHLTTSSWSDAGSELVRVQEG